MADLLCYGRTGSRLTLPLLFLSAATVCLFFFIPCKSVCTGNIEGDSCPPGRIFIVSSRTDVAQDNVAAERRRLGKPQADGRSSERKPTTPTLLNTEFSSNVDRSSIDLSKARLHLDGTLGRAFRERHQRYSLQAMKTNECDTTPVVYVEPRSQLTSTIDRSQIGMSKPRLQIQRTLGKSSRQPEGRCSLQAIITNGAHTWPEKRPNESDKTAVVCAKDVKPGIQRTSYVDSSSIDISKARLHLNGTLGRAFRERHGRCSLQENDKTKVAQANVAPAQANIAEANTAEANIAEANVDRASLSEENVAEAEPDRQTASTGDFYTPRGRNEASREELIPPVKMDCHSQESARDVKPPPSWRYWFSHNSEEQEKCKRVMNSLAQATEREKGDETRRLVFVREATNRPISDEDIYYALQEVQGYYRTKPKNLQQNTKFCKPKRARGQGSLWSRIRPNQDSDPDNTRLFLKHSLERLLVVFVDPSTGVISNPTQQAANARIYQALLTMDSPGDK